MADYFDTRLWAHFRTTTWKPDPDGVRPGGKKIENAWYDHYRIIGFRDGTALVCDTDGHVKTVTAVLAELEEGGQIPDDEGTTWCVSLEVDAWEPGSEG